MYQDFGAVVDGETVEFRLFLPDNQVDPTQYSRGGDPRIASIQVTGDFQSALGGQNWDYQNAPSMQKLPHPNGWLYTYPIASLQDGFYEYKYFVTFENGTSRWCGDPCTKHGGSNNDNAAFVIGGDTVVVQPIENRLPLKDLILYEMMIDDFTANFRGDTAPLDAIVTKIPYLKALGINAIEFMPWTSWPENSFSWGYDPLLFFSVEHRYTHEFDTPLNKLNRLERLINALHEQDIHVILDGVFDHVSAGSSPDRGFPYYWLYEDPGESPFVGSFEGGGFLNDLDYNNHCTGQFIHDVCRYWLDAFQIDGIRFDYVRGFFRRNDTTVGITRLVTDLKQELAAENRPDISFSLEDLPDNRFEAINDTNIIGADACWFDPLLWDAFEAASGNRVRPSLMRSLNANKDFAVGQGPVIYIENHDHSTIANKTGRDRWWRTQPLAIALLTSPGTVLIHNGQEFADNRFVPESGDNRTLPRPLDWLLSEDSIGSFLRGFYARLIQIRKDHPGLRSPNFYPDFYSEAEIHYNAQGYGVNTEQSLVIYHRYGPDSSGQLERFIIVLNCSDFPQTTDVPFSSNGVWQDLLTGEVTQVDGFRLTNHTINSHWGHIYYQPG